MQWTDRHICIGRKCIEPLHEFQSWHEIRNICERKTPVWKNYEPWFRVGNTKHCVQSANCPGNKAQKQTWPAVPDTRISPKFFLSPASGTLSHHTHKKREKRLFHSYKDDKIMVYHAGICGENCHSSHRQLPATPYINNSGQPPAQEIPLFRDISDNKYLISRNGILLHPARKKKLVWQNGTSSAPG